MTKVAFFDCFSGISGDMTIGALLDTGIDFDQFKSEMLKLNGLEFDLELKKVSKKHIAAKQFDIIDKGKKVYRHPKNLFDILDSSSFDDEIKEKAKKIFQKIAVAEAKIHDVPIEKVHFHEVGALDTIVDVIGALVCLKLLEIEKVYCSRLNVGSGFVEISHGRYPVPAPATAEILKGVPVYSTDIKGELITPTGAAIITELANSFCDFPEMTISQIGYGAGSKDLDQPNVLRVFIGEIASENDSQIDTISMIETTIDDLNPQFYDIVQTRLFDNGARDVFLTNILMKKNRPAIKLSVLCNTEDEQKMARIIFQETTSIGLRIRHERKISLNRENKVIETIFGKVNVKISSLEGEIVNIKPEYEDCKRISLEKNIPLKKVYERISLYEFDS